jgi:hypothetical protein
MSAVLTVNMDGGKRTTRDLRNCLIRLAATLEYVRVSSPDDTCPPIGVYDSNGLHVGELRTEDADASTEAINPERELAVRWQERAQELEAINAEMLAELKQANEIIFQFVTDPVNALDDRKPDREEIIARAEGRK